MIPIMVDQHADNDVFGSAGPVEAPFQPEPAVPVSYASVFENQPAAQGPVAADNATSQNTHWICGSTQFSADTYHSLRLYVDNQSCQNQTQTLGVYICGNTVIEPADYDQIASGANATLPFPFQPFLQSSIFLCNVSSWTASLTLSLTPNQHNILFTSMVWNADHALFCKCGAVLVTRFLAIEIALIYRGCICRQLHASSMRAECILLPASGCCACSVTGRLCRCLLPLWQRWGDHPRSAAVHLHRILKRLQCQP